MEPKLTIVVKKFGIYTKNWHSGSVHWRYNWHILLSIPNTIHSHQEDACTEKSALLGTQKRKGIRPISPKWHVASSSVEEWDDDDDDTVYPAKLDTTYLHNKGDVVSCCLAFIWYSVNEKCFLFK